MKNAQKDLAELEILLRKGRSLVERRNYTRADIILKEIAKRSSDYAGLEFYKLGKLYLEDHEYEESIIFFSEIIAIKPQLAAQGFLEALEFAIENKAFEQAGRFFRKLFEISPDSATNQALILGRAYLNEERYDEAIASFMEVIKIKADHNRPCSNLTKGFRKTQKHNETIEALEKAIQLTPKYETFLLLGDAYRAARRYVEAGKAYKRAIEFNIGMEKNMNYDGVSIAFESITDELKKVADDISNQGSLAFKEKRFDDAERLSLTGKNLHGFAEKVNVLLEEWQGGIDVGVRRKIHIRKMRHFRSVPAQQKSPKKRIRVHFKTGKVIEEYYAADTFALAIKEMGMDAVDHLGLRVRGVPLVGSQKCKKYNQRLLDGRMICVHSSTEEKKEMLEMIAKRLGIDMVVNIIP